MAGNISLQGPNEQAPHRERDGDRKEKHRGSQMETGRKDQRKIVPETYVWEKEIKGERQTDTLTDRSRAIDD